MEGNYLTAGELALMEQRGGRGYDWDCHRKSNATATTGVGLAAGLGGGALLFGIAAAWFINQASKARAKAATDLANANMNYINQMSALMIAEKQSREAWQSANAPTIRQYVDVQAGALSGSGANANAFSQAEAALVSGALTGQYARCPQEVVLVSKRNCGCPGGCNE